MNKTKFELEFIMKTSPTILYSRLATPSGLSEWFADDVKINKNLFSFFWSGSEQVARLEHKKLNASVRYKWLEYDEEEIYFEFALKTLELTGELALIITDFVEDEEKEDAISLWENQIDTLKHALGI